MPTIGTILKRSPEKPEKLPIVAEDSGLTDSTSSLSESLNFHSLNPSQSTNMRSNNSRSSSLGSINSTKAVTTYCRPLVSHAELPVTNSKKSVRSLSMDSTNNASVIANTAPENASVSNWSAESISLLSEDTSELSYGTPEMVPTPLPSVSRSTGFQFTRHFSLYSQFTSELALVHCPTAVDELWETFTPSPVWCIDVFNGIIVVGCGNGQIEVYIIILMI